MGARDFVDQAVGSQKAELATGPAWASAGFTWGRGVLGKAEVLQIAVAKAVQGELATADDLQQVPVIGGW